MFSPHEVYSRHLLGVHGCPLWTPQLKAGLQENYQRDGLKIGDVGIVSPVNGSFDVLFNIALSRSEQPYAEPLRVRENFTPVILNLERDLDVQFDAVSAHGIISGGSVELVSQDIHSCDQTPSRADYEFSLSMEDDGAVLILPEGAESCDLGNEKIFLDEAIRHGVEWYDCATREAGRFISNDTFYLITGFHKARSWSLGAAGRSSSSLQNRRSIKFKVGQIHQDRVSAEAYLWVATHGFMPRVGPRYPYKVPNPILNGRAGWAVNQTVFVRGFRITVNKLLFLNRLSVKTQQGTHCFAYGTDIANFLSGRASDPTPSFCTEGVTDNTVEQDFSVTRGPVHTDNYITIDRVPETSQTFHPGDFINQHMLKKAPRAMIAITHDKLWIEMLRMGSLELADFSREERLQEVLSRNYQMIVKDGAIYLQRDHASEIPLPPSSPAMQTNESEEIIITSIKATNVARGLRRVPAGFYAVVHHSGLEWRTENKRSSVKDDIVEWIAPIPLPSNSLATVCLEVYASFEFQPMLGAGEQLRMLTITVEKLLDHSVKEVLFSLSPKDGEIVSPCSSILVAVQRRKGEGSGSSSSTLLAPHRSTTESRGELEDATNGGHSALSYYRKHGEKRDLERSIEEFERALNICPLDHPCRAVAESNLAMATFILCQVEDADTSLDLPLTLYSIVLAARPIGHDDRPSALIQLAAVRLARFEKQGLEVEREQAEALLMEAARLGSAESHEKQAATFLLQMHPGHRVGPVQADGQSLVQQDSNSRQAYEDPWNSSIQLLDRFQRSGGLADLQRAITLLEELVVSTPVWDDRYRAILANFGGALSYRFNHLGELRDLEDAISNCRDAIYLTSHDHPDKLADLYNLGNSLTTRFEHLGELSDIEESISSLREAVELTPDDHPHKPARLNSLGNSFGTRFKHLGEPNDIEEAISTLKKAVSLTPHDHPNMPGHLTNLGNSLITRFQFLGELSDIEKATSMLREAVDLTPSDHPNKPACLNNLGNAFVARFRRLGQLSDLDGAIAMLGGAVDLTPHHHTDRPGYLSNLGDCFSTRFQRLGELRDMEEAISMHKDAVELTPHGHPDKPARLNGLGNSFKARFERFGDLHDLENAISMLRDAVDSTPHGHPDKPSRLNSLGNIFEARFECLGKLCDLQHAISTLMSAADLTPNSHPDKPGRLCDLGNSIFTRFERFGELSDLEEAILMLQEAISLTPDDHPDKPIRLNSLGNSLIIHFKYLGQLSDLEVAISMLRNAVELTPCDHPDRAGRLCDLGNSIFTRFERLGELSDLEEAISMLRDAISLTPDDHPDRPTRLNHLGNSLIIHFEHLGHLSDLEVAISALKDAVALIPSGHPYKPACLNNLGNAFITHFERFGKLDDIEDATSTLRSAVDLTPYGHPNKPRYLNNLGNSLKTRFDHLGQPRDLEDAILTLNSAVDLTPYGHPNKSRYLNNLGNSRKARFDHLGKPCDLEVAITLYSYAACAPFGPVGVRFQASQNWISCARRICHHSLLHAYSVAINLHPQLAWIGLSLTNRYSELMRGADVVREAAAAALDSGLPETAVEWLEQGRSIVWGELFQLRSPHEELSSIHPDLAHRLQEVSAALECASATREKSLSALSEQTQSRELSVTLRCADTTGQKPLSAFVNHTRNIVHHTTDSLQQQSDRQRMLAIERDKLLHKIRRLPGFEGFLLQKNFSQLRTSELPGPVVILNAAESRCDALVVLANVDHVIHVPLPKFPFESLASLQNHLKGIISHTRWMRSGKRAGHVMASESVSWECLLSRLWECVVKAVLDALAFSIPGDLSRIFWCPTGPFMYLPIHAAGFYDTEHSQPGNKASDFIVSSYIPTLSILFLSLNSTVVPSIRTRLRVLLVPQPDSDGLSRLPGAVTELTHIREVIQNSPSACTTAVESSIGTVEEVLSLMKEADWAHFACHATQDANPMNSGLCLADGRRLKLPDIMALSRPRGGLAYLSTCQTATGHGGPSDEAIHIAAGMLFAGYGGVIATTWAIEDQFAPAVARDVYEYLFRNGTMPDYQDAARALHEATLLFRDRGASFHEWVPFIHMGL